MLHTLLLRLRACRAPISAWISARLATPAADESIEYFRRESAAGRL